MIVPSLRLPLLVVLLALATFAAACGEEEERTGLLSQTRATQIKDGLADVDEAVRDGSCTRVRQELDGLEFQLGRLPQGTDPELRARLEEGVAHLRDIAPTECDEQQPETTPETTPDTIPETTPEVVPEPVPTEPVPTEPVEPPVTPEPDTGEGDGGGGGGEETPGNGNGPPGGVPPGQEDSGGQEAPGTELE